jgi:hypothetical protein
LCPKGPNAFAPAAPNPEKHWPTREAAKQVYNRGHFHPCQVEVKKGDLAMSLARQRLFTLLFVPGVLAFACILVACGSPQIQSPTTKFPGEKVAG